MSSMEELGQKVGSLVEECNALQEQERTLALEKKRLRKALSSATGEVHSSPIAQEEQDVILKGVPEAKKAINGSKPSFPIIMLMGRFDIVASFPLLEDRQEYKVAYEGFKLHMTLVSLAMSCLCAFITDSPIRRLSERIFFLLMAYVYLALTLRESILRRNGSRIRGWWVVHHYLSIFLSLAFVLWPFNVSYASMRRQVFLTYMAMSVLNIVQYRYQMSRLYKLRVLGQADTLTVSSDATIIPSTSYWSSWMNILIPGALFVHCLQLAVAHTAITIFVGSGFSLWPALGAGIISATLGIGNMTTTLQIVLAKRRKAKLARNQKSD